MAMLRDVLGVLFSLLISRIRHLKEREKSSICPEVAMQHCYATLL